MAVSREDMGLVALVITVAQSSLVVVLKTKTVSLWGEAEKPS